MSKKIAVLAITLIIISAIIVYIRYQEFSEVPDSHPGSYSGEVYGEFTPSGNIYSHEELSDEKFFLRIYDAEDNQSSNFHIRIWNISQITIGDKEEGVFHYTNYTLINESITIEGPECYFNSLFKNGSVDIEFSELSAKNDDGFFDFDYEFSSVRGTAVLDHKTGPHLDFQLFWSQVQIGNDSLYLKQGSFGFPEDEYANIEFYAHGAGRIKPVPTFNINGSLVITDFKETGSGLFRDKNHDRLAWTSKNITVITLMEPICQIINHEDWELIQPWSIEIRIEE